MKEVTNGMRVKTQQTIDRIHQLKAESLGITVEEYLKRLKEKLIKQLIEDQKY